MRYLIPLIFVVNFQSNCQRSLYHFRHKRLRCQWNDFTARISRLLSITRLTVLTRNQVIVRDRLVNEGSISRSEA